MDLVFGASTAGVRLAELGFLIQVFAGVWIAGTQVPRLGVGTGRTARRMIVGGLALAVAGVLLILAIRYGGFG